MSNITCDNCGYDENPLGATFCDACGCELTNNVTQNPTSVQDNFPPPPVAPTDDQTGTPPETIMPPMDSTTPPGPPETIPMPPSNPSITTPEVTPQVSTPDIYPSNIMGSAKLVSKYSEYPKSEFELSSSEHTIVGRFDDTTGPVDIDLGDFPNGDTISRNQAEIYFDGNQWKINPISTTNGTFIKKAGETRFGSPLNAPEVLNNGDEIAFAKIRFIFQTF